MRTGSSLHGEDRLTPADEPGRRAPVATAELRAPDRLWLRFHLCERTDASSSPMHLCCAAVGKPITHEEGIMTIVSCLSASLVVAIGIFTARMLISPR